jgi:hypothetical protein
MRKEIFFIILALVILIPSVYAATTYDPNTDVTINIQCRVINYTTNSTNYCTLGDTDCNISAYWPNSSYLVANESMNLIDGIAMIYSYDLGNLSNLGAYTVVTYCADATLGLNGTTAFIFKISNTTNTIMTNIFSFLFVILAIILFVIGLYRQDWVFIILSAMLFIVQGFYIYYNHIPYLSGILNLALSWVLWGIGAYLMIRTGIEAIGDLG